MSLARSRLVKSLALAALALVGASQAALAAEAFAAPGEVRPRLIGSEVPSATVQRLDGSEADLRDVVGEKKAVVIFYRGGW
jgi:hypothetical protein